MGAQFCVVTLGGKWLSMSLIYFELQHIIRKHFFTILNKLVWVLRQTQQHKVVKHVFIDLSLLIVRIVTTFNEFDGIL